MAEFGLDAGPVLEDWVAEGNSGVFGIVALEAIGARWDPAPCIRVLGRTRARQPGLAALAGEAIGRLEG